MTNKEWFKKEAKFGLMIHWGLYSLLAGEHRGKRIGMIAEWAQAYFRIPNEEYSQLAKAFNPIYFDAEEWVKLAKDAGMNYMVVTSKHHDGFCMFKSEYDNYNVVDATPFGRDVIGEIAAACKKHGLKLGLYYSQELDWHEPNGGGYHPSHLNIDDTHWTNNWDFPDDDAKNYEQCFRAKILPQIREILTKYGDICLLWCDTPFQITPEQSKELRDLVKELQPECLLNSRIGNGLGDYVSMGDNVIPDEYMEDILVESPTTLNDTWGFKYFDDNWKNADEVIRIKEHLNARGVNYLLNVGPDHLGRIPVPALEILREVGKKQNQ
ncbi:MAG: alpha-L-fucosidase [Clostridia bacterium]|nr:alpha-L-fucosidase [Clostridia bacterium]